MEGEGRKGVDWATLRLSKPLLRALADMKFREPTDIQKEAIPYALAGKDVFAMAPTGSGKTAAFLIPCIERLFQSPLVRKRRLLQNGKIAGNQQSITKILVLLPTRELAAQCFNVAKSLCKYLPITSALISGGTSLESHESLMKSNPDIVIATPGRCLDILINTAGVHFDMIDILVFDEADKLIEMGFKDVCMSVVHRCNQDHQTLLFSATLATKAKELSMIMGQRNPVLIPKNLATLRTKQAQTVRNIFYAINTDPKNIPGAASKDEGKTSNAQIKRARVFLRWVALLKALVEHHEKRPDKPCIVFFNTKASAHKALIALRTVESKFALPRIGEIHGNLSHDQRVAAMEAFRSQQIQCLFCTDLMSRGLDFKDTNVLVINAEIPETGTKFIHRVGRTGRAGKKGKAITLYDRQSERAIIKDIYKAIKYSQEDQFTNTQELGYGELAVFADALRGVDRTVKQQMRAESMEAVARRAETEAADVLESLNHIGDEDGDDDPLNVMAQRRDWIAEGPASNQSLKKIKAQIQKQVKLKTPKAALPPKRKRPTQPLKKRR